jgi:hypothetical protein
MSFFKRLFGKGTAPDAIAPVTENPSAADLLWDEVNAARGKAFEAGFGKLPQDIQKLGNLFGLWPGGGLYVIPAPRVQAGAAIYASFGMSNPDMPTTVTLRDQKTTNAQSDGGNTVQSRGTLVRKEKQPPVRDWPGYGYEIIVAARDNEEWPLWLLQWAVQAEILNDAGLRDRVEKWGGMTVESVQISEDAAVHLLLAKAQAPLMTHLDLPTGRADIIVMTVITDAEMLWSKQHGREALLAQLHAAGVGQFSAPGRESVVSLPDLGAYRCLSLPRDADSALDFETVASREQALALVAQGRLEKILSFPDRFGGEDVAMNQFFVPPGIAALKDEVTAELVQAVDMGLIDNLNVRADYKGRSFVPAKIHVAGTHSKHDGKFDRTIDVW